MTSKNPSSLYGEKYMTWGPKDVQGNTQPRGQDNGHFYELAHTVGHLTEALFDDPNEIAILEVGCGRGFVLRHLQAIGFKRLHGFEYGPLGEIKPVVPFVTWADLTSGLPSRDNTYDLVLCVGVLSHLPEGFVDRAIKELYRVTSGALLTNILIKDHPMQQHHLTVKGKEWWKPRFEDQGFHATEGLDDFLVKRGFRSEGQWAQVWSSESSS